MAVIREGQMGLIRERNTFEKMLGIYCSDHHSASLCVDCRELLVALEGVLAKCPYGDSKPLCSRCSSVCIAEDDRARIADVMHYSGSRMLCRHPRLTVLHFLDLLKVEPERSGQ